ncbi:hypothetical protein SprV_0802636500 [Sparganum proliferum]
MKPQDAAIAHFYGLPKIHKPNVPLRPVVALKGTPTYGLAKWLTKHLKKLTEGSEHTAVSPTHFLERLRGVKVAPDEIMVSFDVVSLFTPIPKELATRVISDLLERRYDEEQRPLKRKHIMELLDYCLSTYFRFYGQVYEQIQGTSMGSPISGYLAEAALQELQTRVFPPYMPKFWLRYMDDTFVILPRDMKETFKSKLNSNFPKIQFTMEEEKDGEIPFLDIQVPRQENVVLQTGVFRKATDTAKILHYSSNHPLSHKRSCVRTLFLRINAHCSTEAEKLRERKSLWRLFLSNGYPRSFINKCLYQRHTKTDGEQKQKPEILRALPYVSDVSEATERMLRQLNVGLGHRPEVTICCLLMQPKWRPPPEDTSGIVYRVPPELIDETFAFELFQSECLWDLDCSKGGDSPSPYTSEKTASCGSNLVRRQSARIQDLVRQRLVEEIQKKNEMLDRGSEIKDEDSSPKTRSKQGHRKKPYSTGKTPKAKGGRRSTKKHFTDPGGLVKGTSNHGPPSDLQHHQVDYGYADEDPTKLWCVCRQPHSGRFMICCDRCDEWYHGDCVGVDPQRGAQMEEFVCPGCRRLDFSPSTTASSAEEQALPQTGYCENATSPRTNSQKSSAPTTTTTVTIHPTQTQNNISNIFEKVSLLRPTEPFRKEQRGPVVPSSERSASSLHSSMGDAGAVVVSAAVKEPTEAISSLPEGQVDADQCPSPVDKTKERAEANLEAPRVISPTSPSIVKAAAVSSEATVGPKKDTPPVERRSWDTPILSLLAASAYPLEGAVDKEDLPADAQSTLKGPLSDHTEETKMATEPSLESRRDTALPACTIRCLGPLCHNQVCPRVGLYCRADCLKHSVTEFLREQQSQTAPEKGPQRVEHPTCQLISLRRKGSTGKRQESTGTSDSKTTARQDSSSGSSKDTASGTKTSKRSVSEERELLRRRLSSVLEERIRQVRHLYTLSRRRLSQLVLDIESAIARRHCLYRLTQAEENKQSVNNHCQLADFRRHSQLLLTAIEADSKLAHLLLVGLISPTQLAVCTSEVRLKVLTQSFADGTVTGVDVVEPGHTAASCQGLEEYRGPETLSALRTQNCTVSSTLARNTDTTAEHERHLYDVNCQKCNSVLKDKKPPDLTVTVPSKQPVANSVPLETLPVRVTDQTILGATTKPSPPISAPISVYTPTLASQPLAELSPEIKGSPKSFAHVSPPLSQHLKRHRPENISASDGFSLPCPAVKRKSLDHLHAETSVNSTTTRQPHLSTGLLSLPFPPTLPSPAALASAKAVCWSGDILLSSRRSGRPDGTLSCSARLATRTPTAGGANPDPPLPPTLRVLGGIDARNMPRHLQKALQSGTMEVLMLRLEPSPSSANFAQAARVQRKLQMGCLAAVLGPRLPRTAGCFLWAPCESIELHLPGSDELSCDDLFVLIIREMPPPSTPSPSPLTLPFATEVLKPAEHTSPVSATVSSQAKTVKGLFSSSTNTPIPNEPIQTTTVCAPQPQDEDLRVLCAGVALDARPSLPPPPPTADSPALPYSADVDYRFLPQRGQQPALHDEDLRSLISTRSSDLSC